MNDIVKFNKAKTTIAIAMTPKQEDLMRQGIEIGASQGDTDALLIVALKAAKPGTDDRICLRAGFVVGYAPDAPKGSKAEKAAQNRFDYLARMHAPAGTSRKAKSTAKKRAAGGGRKTKTAAAVEKMSEKRLAANVVAALAYIADAQAKHSADGDMMEVLGRIAAILSKAK